MGWFEKLCRNAGLMIHHTIHPAKTNRKEVKRTVEEKRVGPTTILRRTTIEEIEIRDANNPEER